MSLEQAKLLMTEVGPLTELAAIVEYDDPICWTLEVDEETAIIVDYDEDLKRFVFSVGVGTPADEVRNEWYEKLLQFNLLWPENGGVRMGLDEPQGEITMLCDLNIHDLDVSTLQAFISNFTEHMSIWQETLSGSSVTPEDATPHSSPNNNLRV